MLHLETMVLQHRLLALLLVQRPAGPLQPLADRDRHREAKQGEAHDAPLGEQKENEVGNDSLGAFDQGRGHRHTGHLTRGIGA